MRDYENVIVVKNFGTIVENLEKATRIDKFVLYSNVRMKKLSILLLFALSLPVIWAFMPVQDFEGQIHFTRTKGEKVTQYTYTVKGSHLRVDEYDANGKTKGVLLVDWELNTVIALSPERKIWMDAYNNRTGITANSRIHKTENTKTIQGYECNEWVVRNENEGREIHFWIGGSEFGFFPKAVKTMNRKDKISKYYRAIDDPGPGFPMIGEELNLDGKLITKLEVTKVEVKNIDAAVFDIPSGYTEFDK